jgi:hypothetical protein
VIREKKRQLLALGSELCVPNGGEFSAALSVVKVARDQPRPLLTLRYYLILEYIEHLELGL